MAAITGILQERGFATPTFTKDGEITNENPEGGLSDKEVKDIEAMADETCHLANLERQLIKEAAIFLSDNLLSFPEKDLKFTKANVTVWLKQYEELSKNF